MSQDLDLILSRTDLTGATFQPFLTDLFQAYPTMGNLQSYQPIPIGYEDANVILDTSTGQYVLKIFANDMKLQNITDHAKVLQQASQIGVPVPEFVPNLDHQTLTHVDTTDCFITRFFAGHKMESPPPTLEDINNVSHFVTRLNTLSFPLFVSNDSWGNNNLMIEFKRDRDKVSPEIINDLKPVIAEYRHFYLENPHYGVIHGDVQRKHIIKNDQGEYCLIDFGVARYDLLVYELSTFLAWFCLDANNWANRQHIIDTVLGIYTQTHALTDAEIAALPLLIRAAYAAYYFRTGVLMSEGDKSQETQTWHHQSQTLLKLSFEL